MNILDYEKDYCGNNDNMIFRTDRLKKTIPKYWTLISEKIDKAKAKLKFINKPKSRVMEIDMCKGQTGYVVQSYAKHPWN